MSEGMLTWQTMNCPFTRTSRQVRKGSASSTANLVSLSQLAFPTWYKGFVSGPSYARKIDSGAKTVRSGTINELFSNSFTGDTGHEYYKRMIKSWSFGNSQYGNLDSAYLHHTPWIPVRQDVGYNPQWLPTTQWWMSDADLAKESVGFLQGTLPLRSEADVMQALIELLREGLPTMLFSALLRKPSRSKRDFIKKVSNDYLAYVFGATPVIREVDKVTRAIASINDLIVQWQRDSGLDVVRRRTTEKEYFSNYRSLDSSGTIFRGYGYTVPLGSSKGATVFGPSIGTSALKRTTVEDSLTRTQRFGFSAAYNYNLEELINHDLPFGLGKMSSSEQSLYIYASALGISPSHVNASLVWELTPFSWLVDWFCNVGQMIDVATTLNKAGLRVLYAYLTVVEELQWAQNWEYVGTSPHYNGKGYNLVQAFSMRRIRATPFGFGTSFEGLNANQGAILAALGGKFL